MELARYVVEAVIREGRSYREVAVAHGVSKSWVAKMVGRYREGGYEALKPRSKAPHRIPHRTSSEMEEAVVLLRKQLTDAGLDAGAATIHYHLSQQRDDVPSVATIWRVLRRRGFITPQPHKRPKSSWIRFEAHLPNQCWQADITHWQLADGTAVDICNIIDDYSRLITASRVFTVTTAHAVTETFHQAANTWGLPASVLTDNGCVFTAWHRGGATTFEVELLTLGIELKHSRPYHPQTCGKVERFHQTLKRYLTKQPRAETNTQLQTQIDSFITYYNQTRPHRAKGRITPQAAFNSRDKARPPEPNLSPTGARVRQDRVDKSGVVTLRHNGRLHHIGIGRTHHRQRVLMLISGLDIRIITPQGELLRQLTLDPTRDYQPTSKPPGPRKTPPPSTMP
jgi:transposase InsO family protein